MQSVVRLTEMVSGLAESTTSSTFYRNAQLPPNEVKILLFYAALLGIISLLIFVVSHYYWRPRAVGWSRLVYYIGSALLLCFALIILAYILNRNYFSTKSTPVFSEKDMINSLWMQYKKNYIEAGTNRVIDTERNVTTSEGQSYALLRAVWMDDRATFDGIYSWTKKNLQRNDGLFSWLYGVRPNGKMGVLTEQSGQNSASDADTDIALSLIFAYSRWHDENYAAEAQVILDSIWSREVVLVANRPYMAADDVEKNSSSYILINPSYLAPYAYRIFAEFDKRHNWLALVDTSYEILKQSVESPLDKQVSAYLPPDWILVNKTSGKILGTTNSNLRTNYSFDAIRTPWRVGLDYAWYREPRAEALLKQFGFLLDEWKRNRLLHADYAHDGLVVNAGETPATYGGSLAAIYLLDPDSAAQIYREKLVVLWNQDGESWIRPLGYYNENWAWFGIAQYNNLLPNLWAENRSNR